MFNHCTGKNVLKELNVRGPFENHYGALVVGVIFLCKLLFQKVSAYDHDMPQLHTADHRMAP